jgi:hypothetical protein
MILKGSEVGTSVKLEFYQKLCKHQSEASKELLMLPISANDWRSGRKNARVTQDGKRFLRMCCTQTNDLHV